MCERSVSEGYLNANKDMIFVFGDSSDHTGFSGVGSKLRHLENTYGFVTMKKVDGVNVCFEPKSYLGWYLYEVAKLKKFIASSKPNTHFIIAKLGSGFANRFGIFDHVIKIRLKDDFSSFKNVEFLW